MALIYHLVDRFAHHVASSCQVRAELRLQSYHQSKMLDGAYALVLTSMII